MNKPNPLKVIIESPYSGNIPLNVEYALECLHDSYYNKCEAPFASHLLYTRLPDSEIKQKSFSGHVKDHPNSRHGREHGILCGNVWMKEADKIVVYTDLGISEGMKFSIEKAKKLNKPIEYRKIKDWNKKKENFLFKRLHGFGGY